MRFRSVIVAAAIAVVSAGSASLATWQLAKRQFAADTLTLPVAAGPKKDRPVRFRVKVDDSKVRVYRTPEDRMGADVSMLVVAVEREGRWVPIGAP